MQSRCSSFNNPVMHLGGETGRHQSFRDADLYCCYFGFGVKRSITVRDPQTIAKIHGHRAAKNYLTCSAVFQHGTYRVRAAAKTRDFYRHLYSCAVREKLSQAVKFQSRLCGPASIFRRLMSHRISGNGHRAAFPIEHTECDSPICAKRLPNRPGSYVIDTASEVSFLGLEKAALVSE